MRNLTFDAFIRFARRVTKRGGSGSSSSSSSSSSSEAAADESNVRVLPLRRRISHESLGRVVGSFRRRASDLGLQVGQVGMAKLRIAHVATRSSGQGSARCVVARVIRARRNDSDGDEAAIVRVGVF